MLQLPPSQPQAAPTDQQNMRECKNPTPWLSAHSGRQLSGRLRSSVKLEALFEHPVQSVDHDAQDRFGYAKAGDLMHALQRNVHQSGDTPLYHECLVLAQIDQRTHFLVDIRLRRLAGQNMPDIPEHHTGHLVCCCAGRRKASIVHLHVGTIAYRPDTLITGGARNADQSRGLRRAIRLEVSQRLPPIACTSA